MKRFLVVALDAHGDAYGRPMQTTEATVRGALEKTLGRHPTDSRLRYALAVDLDGGYVVRIPLRIPRVEWSPSTEWINVS